MVFQDLCLLVLWMNTSRTLEGFFFVVNIFHVLGNHLGVKGLTLTLAVGEVDQAGNNEMVRWGMCPACELLRLLPRFALNLPTIRPSRNAIVECLSARYT